VPNDPEATLRKMEVVLRAALAPVEPSAQDLRVAAQAQAQAAQARVELAELRRAEAVAATEARQAERDAEEGDEEDRAAQQPLPPAPSLELYRRLGEWPAPDSRIDLLA
jgi:septal ring factor EnvC (AmiA/AmiB activator)